MTNMILKNKKKDKQKKAAIAGGIGVLAGLAATAGIVAKKKKDKAVLEEVSTVEHFDVDEPVEEPKKETKKPKKDSTKQK